MANLHLLFIFNSDSMRSFLSHILVFATILTCLLIIIFAAGSYISQHRQRMNGTYVWGDSQMYQGLDIFTLSSQIHSSVFSSAQHGSGVYDFLVSLECMPPHSTCIIAFSECALYRNPQADANRTGMSPTALWTMIKYGCPLKDCIRIVGLNHNKLLYKPFSTSNSLYGYSPEIIYSEPLTAFCNMFNEKKDFAIWKRNVFMRGLRELDEKGCRLILIQFPFYQEVEECAEGSYNRHLTENLKKEIIERYHFDIHTMKIESDSLLMHDLSHLNEVGAKLITKHVAKEIKASTKKNIFLKFDI